MSRKGNIKGAHIIESFEFWILQNKETIIRAAKGDVSPDSEEFSSVAATVNKLIGVIGSWLETGGEITLSRPSEVPTIGELIK